MRHTIFRRRPYCAAAIAGAVAAVLAAGSAHAQVALKRVSQDPFANTTSQHATEVEPDTFAFGNTVVAAFQVGRFFDGGATDIGFARSLDGGATWTQGFLPGLTSTAGATTAFERVSDPSVAYDPKHNVWLVSSIPILPTSLDVPKVFVSRSTDGGATFGDPVSIPPPAKKVSLDKNWTVCDTHPSSPFYGNCYTEFDNFGEGDLEYMSTSRDGGATWSDPVVPLGNPKGLGGQPVVRPNGTVIVPFESLKGTIGSFRSTDGGATWSRETAVSRISFHAVAGDLRTSPLPTAEIDGAGRVYVAWEDCRFEPRCTANDIVFSSSADGVSWSAVRRVPTDAVGGNVDHFIPGLAVDPATTGASAHLALTYYFYPNAACTTDTCELRVAFTSSPDGGAHWSAPTELDGATSLADIARTSQGPMVGDYISTSFNGTGRAATVFAIGLPHVGTVFDEGMWAPRVPLAVANAAQATLASSSAGAHAGLGVAEAIAAVRDD
jgi:hypothetical protein